MTVGARTFKFHNGNGSQPLDQAVSLKEIANQATDRVAKAAAQKKIKLIPTLKDATVKGNQQALADLVAILLDNAIKYSHSGGEIAIDSRVKNKQGQISITDKGVGIKSSDLPRIFERFYRTAESRNKDGAEGYGLGLALAKKIADLHQGSIDVTSAPGKGSTFTLRLPLA